MKLENTSVMLAGWLFADCMLGLMIVGLASDSGTPPTVAATAVRPSAKPTPVPSPTRARVLALGVEQNPRVEEFTVLGKTNSQITATMRGRYAKLTSAGRKAAFVLSFGTSSEPGEGVTSARRANAMLASSVPAVFSGSARRNFWQSRKAGSPASGVVRVEVYLFTAR
jgi:hypothetical protein